MKKTPSSKLQEWDPTSWIYSLSPLFDPPKCASKVSLWKLKNKTLCLSSSSFGQEERWRRREFWFWISQFFFSKRLTKVVYAFPKGQLSFFPPISHLWHSTTSIMNSDYMSLFKKWLDNHHTSMTSDVTRDVICDVTCGRTRFKIGVASQTYSGLGFDNSKLTSFSMPPK